MTGPGVGDDVSLSEAGNAGRGIVAGNHHDRGAFPGARGHPGRETRVARPPY